MDPIPLYAKAFRYPYPGQMDELHAEVDKIRNAPGGKTFAKYVNALHKLSLSEQEELYTRTLDLSPLSAPYVGYHIWGETYNRGEFMANLNREMKLYNIDLEGELPDHLLPILRYMQVTVAPMPELMSVLEQSLNAMHKSLKKEDAKNPYLYVFEALAQMFTLVKVDA